jgi:hypothetical protein
LNDEQYIQIEEIIELIPQNINIEEQTIKEFPLCLENKNLNTTYKGTKCYNYCFPKGNNNLKEIFNQ